MQPGIDGVPALVVAKKFKMNEKGVERLWADIRKLRGKTVFEVAGHIGISVTNVKAGDEVVIMAHNSCPAVLHSRGSAGGDEVQQETYVLVGFAYVEGLRDPHDRTKGENKWLDDDVFKRLQKQGTRLYAIS
ncbi:hypothetical protein IMZ48_22150 [Candidatus Bathyarchaeota archaeon]|nr:hypothetical protein [Candidatus Bathyarchaeota archaeon]